MDVYDPRAQKLTADELVNIRSNCSHTLPAVGFKEFEPSNSLSELKQIDDALQEHANMLATNKVDKLSYLTAAEWNAERKLALVTRRAGGHFEVMGHEEGARLWLYPEEILLLLEMSRAELWFGNISMSIQQGYAMLLGNETGCREVEYSVYKHLSHLGYRVLRHRPGPTQYELDIRLNQYPEKPTRRLSIAEKEVMCVGRMPEALMEEDPAETKTDSSQRESTIVVPPEIKTDSTHRKTIIVVLSETMTDSSQRESTIVVPSEAKTDSSHRETTIAVPSVNTSAISPTEDLVRSASKNSMTNECNSTERPEEDSDFGNISSDKFPDEFMVIDEWVNADENEQAESNETASIADDDGREIIGVTLETKQVLDDVAQDDLNSKRKPASEFLAVDDVAQPGSPKFLAEICPQIRPQSSVSQTDSARVADLPSASSLEIVPTPSPEANKGIDETDVTVVKVKSDEQKPLDDDANIFSDLNAFLDEICPTVSSKLSDDISPVSGHTDKDFIALSGADNSETVLNSLAEINASESDAVDETDDEDEPSPTDYSNLKAGFNVVIGQNKCPVLIDVPEREPEKSVSRIVMHGKRPAEAAEEGAGPSKRSRPDKTGDLAASSDSDSEEGLDAAASSAADKLVNGEISAAERHLVTEPGVGGEARTKVEYVSIDSETDDEDCLDISPGRDEPESPILVEEEDSDLEVIEMSGSDVEDLAITISNKRKQTDGGVARSVKRRQTIEVVNLSDEETESGDGEDSGDETEDQNETAEESAAESDSSDGSSLCIIEQGQQQRKKFWDPSLLEDTDRMAILRSIVNVADRTQVDVKVDWRYIPSNCHVFDRRVKVFRLNAIGLGGKPSVDYVPAHQLIESHEARSSFLPLARAAYIPPLLPTPVPPPGYGQPPMGSPYNPNLASPWEPPNEQRTNFQITVQNSFAPHQFPWQQPPPAFISPGNVGYAIPSSFPRPAAPIFHHVFHPRMQNRSIRGVAMVPKPQRYQPAVTQPSHGWFQQNNVFNAPNTIQVELPPALKREPWNPGVMQRMKCEDAKPPIARFKHEADDLEHVPIAGFTMNQIFGICRAKRLKSNQKKALMAAWRQMIKFNTCSRHSRKILKIFERKSPLLAGLPERIMDAFGNSTGPVQVVSDGELNRLVANIGVWLPLAPVMHAKWMQVKRRMEAGDPFNVTDVGFLRYATNRDARFGPLELLISKHQPVKKEPEAPCPGTDASATEAGKRVDDMMKACPLLGGLTEKQVNNLKVALALRARGQELEAMYTKVLVHTSRMLVQSATAILKDTLQPTPASEAMISWANYVSLGTKLKPSAMLQRVKVWSKEWDLPADAAEPKTEAGGSAYDPESAGEDSDEDEDEGEIPSEAGGDVPSEANSGDVPDDGDGSTGSGSSSAAASEQEISMEDLSVLIGNIREWLTITPEQYATWTRAKERIKYGEPFGAAEIDLFRYAVERNERFQGLEHLIKRYDEQNEMTLAPIPSIDEARANALKMIKEMVVACPKLADLTAGQGECLKFALMKKTYGNDLTEQHLDIFKKVEELLIESARCVLKASPQPTNAAYLLVKWANHVSSERKWDYVAMAEEMKRKELERCRDSVESARSVTDSEGKDSESSAEDKRKQEGKVTKVPDEAGVEAGGHLDGQSETDSGDATRERVETASRREESRESACRSADSEDEIVEPLLKRSDCTDFASVLSKLDIIKPAPAEPPSKDGSFKFSYDLYAPVTGKNTPFRKSEPGTPDYRIVVLSPDDGMPDAAAASALGKSWPDRVPILFAVVRAGTVSFLRLDAVRLPADLTDYGAKCKT